MDLDRRVRDLLEHAGGGDLGEPHLRTGVLAGRDQLDGLVDEGAGGAQREQGVEHVLLDQLLVGERPAGSVAGGGPCAHEVEGALGLAEPAQAAQRTPEPQAFSRDGECAAGLSQEVVGGYPDPVELDLVLACRTEHGEFADHAEPG